MISIHYYDGNNTLQTVDVQENDNSYRYRALMQMPQLILKFSMPEYIEFPVGAYCIYDGETYYLQSQQDIKKNGTRDIEYTMKMGTYQDNMTLYKMRNSVDGRLKYSLCTTPSEFINEIIANLNARDGANVWHRGTCIDLAPKTIEFNHTYVWDALQMVAEAFETEWEIVNHYIHLHKVEYNFKAPLALSYGKGNGFVPGVGRTTPSGEMPVKRLYVQGGDRNIDPSRYLDGNGNAQHELLLPKNKTLIQDGRTYQSDASGIYIERVDELTDSAKEDSIDCSDIYPSRTGTVSSVVVVDATDHLYDFVDSSIPNDLDYSSDSVMIAGETMTVIFQTGMLAGKEFDISNYDHASRRFQIVPAEIDGQVMPNNVFAPAVGDTYIIFGVMVPDAYVCNDSNQTGASWDMFRQAAHYLRENEDLKFTFTGTLQALWVKTHQAEVSGKLVVGGYIDFSDTQFAIDGTMIRITGIKDYLTDPYAPQLELANGVTGQSIGAQISQIDSQEVQINELYNSSINFTKRRWRDAIETLTMLQQSLLNFSEGLNPITVQTMALLVGDESLQFVFVQSLQPNAPVVTFNPSFNTSTKRFVWTSAYLRHMTLGINSISSQHSQYLTWQMNGDASSVLSDASKKYYFYAKVAYTSSASGQYVATGVGTFLLSETAIAMNRDAGYFHLLVGILNSEFDGDRSFVSLYGFTEILPGRVTTDLIISGDGNSYFDLANGYLQANYALIRGSIRSPFHDSLGETQAYQKYDNIYFLDTNSGDTPGSMSGPLRYVQLDWDTSQSGRKLSICGSGRIGAPPTGKYLYMDGVGYSYPISFYNEIITLVGYGDEINFYGWVLTNRQQLLLDTNRPFYYFGKEIKALAFGIIGSTVSGVNLDRLQYSSFDGTRLTVDRRNPGVYVLKLPISWFAGDVNGSYAADRCVVMATPMATGNCNVGVSQRVYDSENHTLNVIFNFCTNGVATDGCFSFVIYSAMQWQNYDQSL